QANGQDRHGQPQQQGRAPRLRAQRRGERQRHGQGEQGGNQDEDGHHHSCPSSGGTSLPVPGARRRTIRTTTNAPTSSSTPGPNHSSQVLADTRGRYSTNSP